MTKQPTISDTLNVMATQWGPHSGRRVNDDRSLDNKLCQRTEKSIYLHTSSWVYFGFDPCEIFGSSEYMFNFADVLSCSSIIPRRALEVFSTNQDLICVKYYGTDNRRSKSLLARITLFRNLRHTKHYLVSECAGTNRNQFSLQQITYRISFKQLSTYLTTTTIKG